MTAASLFAEIPASGGARIAYLAQGAGPTLVLLHGIGSAAASWQLQFAALSDQCHLIAWDAPGCGESTALPMPAPTAGDYASRLLAFLDVLRLPKIHLLGHSLGALIAARFAADHPERVISLTLASIATGHARLPAEERARLMRARLDDLAALGPLGMAEKRGPRLATQGAPEAVRRAIIDTMARVRPDGYTQAVHMLSQGDTLADIARLPPALPVQVVFGDGDVITTPAQNRSAAAAREDIAVHVIEDAGHAVYLEQPGAFDRCVAGFVQARG